MGKDPLSASASKLNSWDLAAVLAIVAAANSLAGCSAAAMASKPKGSDRSAEAEVAAFEPAASAASSSITNFGFAESCPA